MVERSVIAIAGPSTRSCRGAALLRPSLPGRKHHLSPFFLPPHRATHLKKPRDRSSASLPHQILQACSLTIASPFLHPNAFANSAIFDSGPFPLNLGNGCGFVFASNRAYSSRSFAPQICAQPKKNRCSAVNPSFSGGRGFPSSDFSYAAYAIVNPPRSAMLSPSTSLPFSCKSPSTTYPSNWSDTHVARSLKFFRSSADHQSFKFPCASNLLP